MTVDSEKRHEIELSGPWRFHFEPEGESMCDGYHQPLYDDHGWNEMMIPSVFDQCTDLEKDVIGTGWYRLHFTVSDYFKHKRLVLQFDGSNFHSSIWINGKHAGNNHIGYLPFEIPISDHIEFGQDNILAICVDNVLEPWELPSVKGWRNQGGIIRKVRIIATDHVYIKEVSVNAVPRGNCGRLEISALVANESSSIKELCLGIDVIDGDIVICRKDVSIKVIVLPYNTCSVRTCLKVDDIIPWFPQHPHLYYARIRLVHQGSVIDQLKTRFGFRRITIKGRHLLINEQKIFLVGFNRHDDTFHTGMALDEKATLDDLRKMKEIGANYIRLGHYPHSTYELDLCDELGFVVMAEIPFYGTGEGKSLDASLLLAREYLRKMIKRDMNHPSVVFWSVSNETGEESDKINKANDSLIKLCKHLDRSRLATHVSERKHWSSHKAGSIFTNDDIICINGYPTEVFRTWQKDDSYNYAESRSFWYRSFEDLSKLYPDKPILVTEFGYPTKQEFDGRSDEEIQALAIEAEFSAMDDDYIVGCSIWCYADHLWPVNSFAQDISPYGVLNRDRTEKKSLKIVKELFSSIHADDDQQDHR